MSFLVPRGYTGSRCGVCVVVFYLLQCPATERLDLCRMPASLSLPHFMCIQVYLLIYYLDVYIIAQYILSFYVVVA